MSRSSRARGLKLTAGLCCAENLRSRSSRARGLKQNMLLVVKMLKEVALFTGAWIEIAFLLICTHSIRALLIHFLGYIQIIGLVDKLTKVKWKF